MKSILLRYKYLLEIKRCLPEAIKKLKLPKVFKETFYKHLGLLRSVGNLRTYVLLNFDRKWRGIRMFCIK